MDRSLEVTSVEPTFSPVACPITQVLKDSGETSFCAEGPHRSASLYLKTPRLGQLVVLVALCNPMDCILPGSSDPWGFPGKNTGVGCHSLLQGIFPTQGLNLGLLHCKQILYHRATGEGLGTVYIMAVIHCY